MEVVLDDTLASFDPVPLTLLTFDTNRQCIAAVGDLSPLAIARNVVIGRPADEVLAAAPATLTALDRCLEGEPSEQDFEANGAVYSCAAQPELDGAGDVVRAIIALWDADDRTPDAVFCLDDEDRLIEVNDTAQSLFERWSAGESEFVDDPLGVSLWELVPHLVDTGFHDAVAETQSSGERRELMGYDPVLGGWVESIHYATDAGVEIRIRELNDRQRTDLELDRLRDHVRTIMGRITDRVAVFDAEMRCFYLDPAMEAHVEALGVPASRAIGMHLYDLFPEHTRPTLLETVQEALETELPVSVDTCITDPETDEEQWLRIRVYPNPEGFAIYETDVTDEKQHEEAKVRAERDRDDALDRVDDLVFSLDTEGRLTYVNQTVQQYVDLMFTDFDPDEELIGTPIWERFSEFGYSKLRSEAEKAMESGEVRSYEEYLPEFGRWFESTVYPSETGVTVYGRDVTERRSREQLLTSLHHASRQMLQASTASEVAEYAVDAAQDVLELRSAAVLLLNDRGDELQVVAFTDHDGTKTDFSAASYGPGTAYWTQFLTLSEASVDDSGHIVVPMGTHGIFVARAETDLPSGENRVELTELLASTAEATLERVAREEHLRKRERELKVQTAHLETLQAATELIRAVEHALVLAESRSAIESAVCEAFCRSGPFAFAWIGRVDDGQVLPRDWAGQEHGYLDALADLADEAEPSALAAERRAPVVVDAIPEGLRAERWRAAALTRGFQSAMSVPIVHDGHVYAVLTVYSTSQGTFDELTQTVVEELSRTIAYAIDSVEAKRGFLTNRVVELVVRTTRSEDVLSHLARQTGATVTFEGTVSGEGYRRIFVTVSGAEPDAVVSCADASTRIESVRLLASEGDESRLELVSDAPLFVDALVDRGAVPKKVEVTPEETEAVVELAHDVEVRTFVRSLHGRYDDLELLARRDSERRPMTTDSFLADLEERLTERGLEALKTAYFSGYFNSPRTTNGRDVAALLSISQPTFNYHLRRAEDAVFELLFGERVVTL